MSSQQQPEITIHHLEASRSLRVLWLLEYLGLDYKIQHYHRSPETRFAIDSVAGSGKGLAAVHPLGRSPVLTLTLVTESSNEKITIAEANAILTYLLQNHPIPGDARPMDPTQAGQDLNFWISFGEASIMLHAIPLTYGRKGQILTQDGTSAFEKACARGLKADLDFVERTLVEKGGTLMGTKEVGPADVVVESSIEMFQSLLYIPLPDEFWHNLGITLGPATLQWMEKCRDSEAYKAATEKEVKGGSGKAERGGEWMSPMTK